MIIANERETSRISDSKTVVQNQTKQHKTLAIDLGNKKTKVLLKSIIDNQIVEKKLIINTNLVISAVKTLDQDILKVSLNNSSSLSNCLFDFLAILGLKINQQQFQKRFRFYSCLFLPGRDNQIEVKFQAQKLAKGSQQAIGKCHKQLHLELLVTLFLKTIVNWALNKQQEGQERLELGIIVPNCSSHTYRNAIIKSAQAINLKPILLKCTNAIIIDYYYSNKSFIKVPKYVCVIDHGDQFLSIGIYQLYDHTQNVIDCIEIAGKKTAGLFITSIIIDLILSRLKTEKGIDIKKNTHLMAQLVTQAQYAKKMLSKQSQAYIRIEDLPDNSVFGYLLTKDKFQHLVAQTIEDNLQFIKSIVSKYQKLNTIIVAGNTSNITYFRKQISKQFQQFDLVWKDQESASRGLSFYMQQQLILFDVSPSTVIIQPQQYNPITQILKNNKVPVRKIQLSRFPPGDLEFILRLYEDGRKIGQFNINQCPPNYNFDLIFQVDRNGIYNLYGSMNKGKVKMIQDYKGINSEQTKAIGRLVKKAKLLIL